MARTDAAPVVGLIQAGRTRALGAAAGAAGLLGLAGFLFSRLVHSRLTYDEGVYLLSVDALRHGEQLGTQVFAAQPPGFYLLLRGLEVVAGGSVTAVRWGMVVAAVLVLAGVALVANALSGRLGAVLAAALLVIAPPFPLLATSSYGDLLPMVLAVPALALVARPGARGRAVAASGVLLAAALSVKLTAAVAVPAYAAFLLAAPAWKRRLAHATAGFVALAGAVALAFVQAIGTIWSQAVSYHLAARDVQDTFPVRRALGEVFELRTPFFWLLCAGVLAAVAVRDRRLLVWLFPASALALAVEHRPLFEHHLVQLPIALATAAGVSLAGALPRLRMPRVVPALAALSAALFWTAGYVQQLHRVDSAFLPEDPAIVAAASKLAQVTKPGEYVVTDQPAVALLAGRPVPGPLVDTSFVRFRSGEVTDAAVLASVDRWRVRAAAVGRSFALRPKLVRRLRERFPETGHADGIEILYSRAG